MTLIVTEFSARRPALEVEQSRSLEWLARAHARAEVALGRIEPGEEGAFVAAMRRRLSRFACGPDKIRSRGSVVLDFGRDRPGDMSLYDAPRGRGTEARSLLFEEIVNDYFAREYESEAAPPADLIHVTCTGYVGPSGAQRLVARRGWGGATRVTHAYHMGCYAAVPALRIASGYLLAGSPRADIVHTELCTLHLDPGDHSPEQLVVQSLFGDGLIRYSLRPKRGARDPGLEVLALDEVIVSDSAGDMRWVIGDRGMAMTLARVVPEHIAAALRPFVARLLGRGGLSVAAMKGCLFAVHPGGPRIIDGVRDALELDERQVATSRGVLLDFGNMSSATLPHVWQRVLDDPSVTAGTPVVSLAFGPGLTISGALFRKAG